MVRHTFAAVALIVSAASAAAKDAPKLEFSTDGNDLVVKTTLTVNASSHVLWTDTVIGGQTTFLRYHVFQCKDLLVRSQKPLTVEWRIPGGKTDGMKFEVADGFLPSTAQLKALLPQLEKLAAEGEKFERDGGAKKD